MEQLPYSTLVPGEVAHCLMHDVLFLLSVSYVHGIDSAAWFFCLFSFVATEISAEFDLYIKSSNSCTISLAAFLFITNLQK